MKNKSRNAIFAVFFAVAVLFLGHGVEAQFAQTDFSFSTKPSSPGPNERVEVSIESLSLNLNNYFITWYLDRQKQQGNYGLTTFSFFTEDIGEESEISVILQLNSAQVIRKTLVVSPVEIDLIWEANTYTPPFYKGKALPNRESEMKVVAIPQTAQITPNEAYDLVYYWRRDGKAVPLSSGYGKQSYTFDRNLLEQEESISVSINDRSGNSTGEKTLRLDESFLPEILVYLRDSDDRLLMKRTVKEGESVVSLPFTLSAQPYYFSDSLADLSVLWNINGQNITPTDEASPTDITLYPESGVSTADINISIESFKKLYEESSLSLIINV